MVGNEEENESDSEEEHSSEEESGNFVLLIFGSCFFVLFTGCFWAKKEVRRHVQKNDCTLFMSSARFLFRGFLTSKSTKFGMNDSRFFCQWFLTPAELNGPLSRT